MKFALRFLLAVCWIATGIVYAKDVTLAWDYPSETEALVDYYEVSWINPSEPYTEAIQIDSPTQEYTVVNLVPGVATFRVRACPIDTVTYSCSEYLPLSTRIPSVTSTPTLSTPP